MFKEYMNLRSIKSALFPMFADEGADDGGGITPAEGAQDGIAPAEAPAEPEIEASEDAGEEGEKPEEGSGDEDPAEEQPIIEVDGVQYTASQIQEALDIKANQSTLAAQNSQKAEELSIIEKYLEKARLSEGSPSATESSTTPEQPATLTGEELQRLIYEEPDKALEAINNHISNLFNSHATESEAKTTFMNEYPDFNQTIKSPEYQNYINQHPLGSHFNSVTGYLAFKNAEAAKAIENAKTEGFNKGEKTTLANQKAKGNIRVLNGSGVTQPTNENKITADMSHAEILQAATNNIIAMRKASGK